MRLVWLAVADRDLDEIVNYIEQDSPAAAIRVEDRIVEGAEMLTRFPKAGRAGRVNGTRELAIHRTPYIVAYRVVENAVVVLRVLHGARQWPDAFL
jgi:addiction module RelE/StbE family toxin